jgi:hypothetical protein
MKGKFIHFLTARVNSITLKTFIPYLQTTEIKLTAKHTVHNKLQIQQLNVSYNIYVEPQLWVKKWPCV